MSFAHVALLASMTAAVAQAHVQMSYPPTLRGENNPDYDFSSYDYSMTNPLNVDGSNFPCKGYQTDVGTKAHAQATLKAGQSFTAKFAPGGATHGGGSCQFALSYDGGKSFGVVHSVIGGCPLQESYTFKLPSALPAGKEVLFGWSWMNKVGNREFYQNCAAVNVESSSTAPLTLPRIFEANIFGAGTCNTVEGDEVVFPNPGDSVEYGGKWAGQKPGKDALQLTNCSGDKLSGQTSSVTLRSNTGASSGGDDSLPPSIAPAPSSTKPSPSSSSTSQASSSSTTRVQASVQLPSSSPALSVVLPLSSTKVSQSTPPAAGSSTPSPPATGGASCSSSSLKCSQDGSSFSSCANGKWVNMGKVAPGTTCKDGAIVLAQAQKAVASDKCTSGTLKCTDGDKKFSLCNADGNGWTPMGSVAAGTKCQDGAIVLAKRHRRERPHHQARRLSNSH